MRATYTWQLSPRIAFVAAILGGCGSEAASPHGSAGAGQMPVFLDAGSAGAAGGGAAPEAGAEGALAAEPSPEGGQNDVLVEAGTFVDPSANSDGPVSCSPYITSVIDVTYGPGAGFGQNAVPRIVQGPPSGGGCCQGSLSVLSLGEGGTITVELGETIIDGPGPDFIVFENAFNIAADPKNPFAEPATVEVSADGVTWIGFPCTAGGFPYGLCAGWHPVLANPASNQIDPTDSAVAGGDAFDLADLSGDAGLSEARYVRITDRADLSGDFDLDAVSVVHGRCR